MGDNKSLFNEDREKDIDCTDIYTDEMNKGIKSLKRFREIWLRSSSEWSMDLFQYADPDFYFYRFAIDRQEKNTEPLLINILYQMMRRYEISFEVPNKRQNAVFAFIIKKNDKRVGYRFKDFYSDEDIKGILQTHGLDEAYIIRTRKSDEGISRENRHYIKYGLKLRVITLMHFFEQYFGCEEYDSFLSCVKTYLRDAREITGYKPIKFLSSMNLASQKAYEEKLLIEWQYDSYCYQIIDTEDKKIGKYLYLADTIMSPEIMNIMEENYIVNSRYKTMTGTNKYAESFITSEWLFNSLKEKKNFDYTSVISGYLKSLEQLLHNIVMLNIDNNCRISISGAKNTINKAKKSNVIFYEYSNQGIWSKANIKERYKYIDFTTDQVEFMDSSMGTFEHFLRKNPHIFIDQAMSTTIADMVSCFRIECRNGFFHTHNLSDWSIVEKTRANAIYLYFLLLGACVIPKEKEHELGIHVNDRFDELCIKIREFRHYNPQFIFEYEDGRKINLIYDSLNNTIEYSENGSEHYESLLFYKVNEFSQKAYEELDEGIKEEQKVYLTRESIPSRIFGVHRAHRNHEQEEIVF